MQHFYSLDGVYLNDVWLTIGTYDGVHRGHQEIIRRIVSEARQSGGLAVALTFFPPPAVVLKKRTESYYLTSPEERAALLGALGVDVVITHPFNLQVAAMSAREFMTSLHEHFGLKHLCVGYDFALGRGREGDVPMLQRLGGEFGYSVEAVKPVEIDSKVVSSSLIRTYLAAGDVEQAAQLLGRPYQVGGEVVLGDRRGKLLGIPTANLSVWAERALPKAGVYVCHALLKNRMWGAVTNVGVRPTFENQPVQPRVEAHILDFREEIYGEQLSLDFLAHLRDEARFPSVQALVEQINKDISRARIILDSSLKKQLG
jgi:riboflavin kinase / FMN adenylyltransferase